MALLKLHQIYEMSFIGLIMKLFNYLVEMGVSVLQKITRHINDYYNRPSESRIKQIIDINQML